MQWFFDSFDNHFFLLLVVTNCSMPMRKSSFNGSSLGLNYMNININKLPVFFLFWKRTGLCKNCLFSAKRNMAFMASIPEYLLQGIIEDKSYKKFNQRKWWLYVFISKREEKVPYVKILFLRKTQIKISVFFLSFFCKMMFTQWNPIE